MKEFCSKSSLTYIPRHHTTLWNISYQNSHWQQLRWWEIMRTATENAVVICMLVARQEDQCYLHKPVTELNVNVTACCRAYHFSTMILLSVQCTA